MIGVTVIVRGFMFPLSRKQAKNTQDMQEKMAKLGPEVKKLQEKYKDDPTRMNTEVMKIYREYGVNPVSGCLPLIN